MSGPPHPRLDRRCRICGARLASDRPYSATACSCHPEANEDYNPRHDKWLDDRVLWLLTIWEGPVNVWLMLGTTDYDAIRHSVQRLRRDGHEIVGVPGVGYWLK